MMWVPRTPMAMAELEPLVGWVRGGKLYQHYRLALPLASQHLTSGCRFRPSHDARERIAIATVEDATT